MLLILANSYNAMAHWFLQHDSTVKNLADALNVNIGPMVPYTSTFMIELFNTSGSYHVEVWYKNDSASNNTKLLSIPGKTDVVDLANWLFIPLTAEGRLIGQTHSADDAR